MIRRASPAFSLIELLVALTITGLCLGLVAMSFGSIYRAHVRAREHMELQQTMDESIEQIRMMLQAAYLSQYFPNTLLNKFESMDDDNLSDPYDAITFTTLAHGSHQPDAKEADLAEITFFTEDEAPLETPDGQERLRRLRVRVGGEINSRFEVEDGVVYTLADHVTGFHLEYLDQFGEWKPEWIAEDNQDSLPCAIKVILAMRSATIVERQASLIIPMEMTRLECTFEEDKVIEK